MLQHGIYRRAVLVEVSEQQTTLQRRHDHPRASAGVSPWEFSLTHAASNRLLEGANELRHRLARSGAQPRVGVVALDSQIHDWAPAMEGFVAGSLAKDIEEREERFGRRRATVGGPQEAVTHPGHGVLESLERQAAATFEVPVDPALPQSGDAHDLRHRRAAIALGVEKTGRLGDDAPSRCFALLHAPPRKGTDRSLNATYQIGGGVASGAHRDAASAADPWRRRPRLLA